MGFRRAIRAGDRNPKRDYFVDEIPKRRRDAERL